MRLSTILKKMNRHTYQKRIIGNGWVHKSYFSESENNGSGYDPVDSITNKFNKLLTVSESHYPDEGEEEEGNGFSIRPTFIQPEYSEDVSRKVVYKKKSGTVAPKTKDKKGEGLFFKGVPISKQDGSGMFFQGVPISAQNGSGYGYEGTPVLSVEKYTYEKRKPRARLNLSAQDFIKGSGLTIYD